MSILAEQSGRARRWLVPAAFAAFALVLLVNAWVVDDAYITFRTIDNFVNGHGLRWNVDERVQVYTHPLWMLFFTPFYFVTREAFFTSILVSAWLTIGAVWIAARSITRGWRAPAWKPVLLLVALVACKAFVDYASSGLESPLSYVLVAGFWTLLVETEEHGNARPPRATSLVMVASLLFLNHADLVLLVAPALVAVLAGEMRRSWRSTALAILVGTLPATLWVLFALFYYGSPLPNTAYAKVLCTGFPVGWKVTRGLEYLGSSLLWDGAAYVMLVAGVALAVARRHAASLLLMTGVLAHMTFVVLSGAASTHMSGRFFAVSLFVAVVVFVHAVNSRRLALVGLALLAGFIAWSPTSALKFGTAAYARVTYNPSCIDTKWYAAREGVALVNWRPGRSLPDNEWYRSGEEARRTPERVIVGGAPGSDAIGYFGFAAGPGKFIVDRVALSDPLLARLPAIRPASSRAWKSGHFTRALPDGYLASVDNDANLIVDPEVHRLYASLRRVTRGPLFTAGRLRDTWALDAVTCAGSSD